VLYRTIPTLSTFFGNVQRSNSQNGTTTDSWTMISPPLLGLWRHLWNLSNPPEDAITFYSLHPTKCWPGVQKHFQQNIDLKLTSKDIMIFTKIKGNLGKWPQDIPVLMRTMAADVKNPLARHSHFDRHNECHIGRIWTGPFESTWPNRLSGNISDGDLRRNA
jgi:hypothetical protein